MQNPETLEKSHVEAPVDEELLDFYKSAITESVEGAEFAPFTKSESSDQKPDFVLKSHAGVVLDTDTAALTKAYATQEALAASRGSWWNMINERIQRWNGPEQPVDFNIAAINKLVPRFDSDSTAEASIEVVEVNQELSERDRVAIQSTFELLDQMTGMAFSALLPKVVFVSGLETKAADDPNRGKKNGEYVPTSDLVIINMDNIQAISEFREIPKNEVLASILVHELFHFMDDKVAGEKWFEDRFDYSANTISGENHTVHETITPKDHDQHSHPVSEYGAVDSFEDLATSAQSYIGTMENWKTSSEGYEGPHFDKDKYRHDLVLELMDKAADTAALAEVEGATGTVSSGVKYEKDANGEIHAAPDHSYEWQNDDGVIQRAIDTLIARSVKPIVTYAIEQDNGI